MVTSPAWRCGRCRPRRRPASRGPASLPDINAPGPAGSTIGTLPLPETHRDVPQPVGGPGPGFHFTIDGLAPGASFCNEQAHPNGFNTPFALDYIGLSSIYGFYYPFMALDRDLSWGIQPNLIGERVRQNDYL